MKADLKTFSIKKIQYPVMIFRYDEIESLKPVPLIQLFRTSVTIVSNNTIELLFGIQVLPEHEKADELDISQSKLLAMVELVATFEVVGNMGKPEAPQDIPFLPNMFASIYPFVRERVHAGFSVNHYDLFVPSINFYDFIKDLLNKIFIVDLSPTEPCSSSE